jgi:hypothetical protein
MQAVILVVRGFLRPVKQMLDVSTLMGAASASLKVQLRFQYWLALPVHQVATVQVPPWSALAAALAITKIVQAR